MKRFVLLLIMWWLVGCAGPPPPTAVSGPEEVETTLPTEPAEAEADANEVAPSTPEPDVPTAEPTVALDIVAEDVTLEGANVTVQGTFWAPAGAEGLPTVLLLHMLGSERSAWNDFAPQLAENGYAVLAIDMRGHGETGGERNWQLAEKDLRLTWDYLATRPEADVSQRGVIGASIGANMALRNVSFMPEINTAVLLSPGLDYQGVRTDNVQRQVGSRPVLIIASSEDSYAAESSRELETLLAGSRLEMYEGLGHGTTMLGRGGTANLEEMIIDWLNTQLGR